METLNLKQQFLIAAFLTNVLENSEKLFNDSSMNYLKEGSDNVLCFDDKQKEAIEKFINIFSNKFDSITIK